MSQRIFWISLGMFLLAAVGLADALYLTVSHYADKLILCSVTAGCEVVLSSKYSEIAGFPTALYGVMYYAIVASIALWVSLRPSSKNITLLTRVPILGFITSLGFLYIQAFVLKAWCQFCLVSAFTSTILFILGLLLWRYGKTNSQGTPKTSSTDGAEA